MEETRLRALIEMYEDYLDSALRTIQSCRENILHYNKELVQLDKELKQRQAEGLFKDSPSK